MRRFALGLTAALSVTGTGSAHFLYVTPAATGAGFAVAFNDTPQPDETVRTDPFDGAKFTRVAANGAKSEAVARAGKPGQLVVEGAAATVYGSVPYGVVLRGDPHPVLIVYHPKTVATPVTPGAVFPVAGLSVELTPTATSAGVSFLATEAGKPLAGQVVLVHQPGEAKPTAVTTGADGRTPAFEKPGEYAARAYRMEVTGEKEFQGRKFHNIRHYATLTVRFTK